MKKIDLSIIIANYNRTDLVKNCINSIYQNTKDIGYEIIVIDDHSTDKSIVNIKKLFPDIRLIINKNNLGPIVANNNGLIISRGRYCLILDNDTLLKNNVFQQMIDFMDKNQDVGVTGCNLVFEDGSFQKSCGSIFKPSILIIRDFFLNIFYSKNKITDKNKFTEDFHNKINEVSYVSGACYMIRRETMEQVGLVDEQYYMYAEEQDWFYRIIKQGWKIFHLPYGPVIHFEGASGRKNENNNTSNKFKKLAFKNMILFYKKNYGILSSLNLRIIMFISLITKYVKGKIFGNKNKELEIIHLLFSNINVDSIEPKIKRHK